MIAPSLSRPTRHRLLVCLLLLTGLLAAGAGVLPTPAQRPPPPEGDRPVRGVGSEPDEWKSPALALGLSLGETAVPLFASTRATDAHDKVGLWAVGLGVGASITGAGMVLMLGTVYDIATAPLSAKEFNEAHDLNTEAPPVVGPQAKRVGLALRVRP